MNNNSPQGTLYIVATPIGNLEDISYRAVSCLKTVDYILTEDTRKFSTLAKRYEIETPRISCYEHNEAQKSAWAIEQLTAGQSLALTCSAGTPTISDPGYRLVSLCQKNRISVSPIPGPCAAITALSASGLPTNSFTFRGFMPVKQGRKLSTLTEALSSPYTTIFYESPHRIIKTVSSLFQLDPNRHIFIARELSKIYEECIYGTTGEVLEELEKKPGKTKGEFVLIVSPQLNKKTSL